MLRAFHTLSKKSHTNFTPYSKNLTKPRLNPYLPFNKKSVFTPLLPTPLYKPLNPIIQYQQKRHFYNAKEPISGQKQIVPIEFVDIKKSAMETINKDKGLSDFIKRTYLFTGGALASSLTLSHIASTFITGTTIWPTFGAGIVLAFGGIFGISYSKYKIHMGETPITPCNSNFPKNGGLRGNPPYWYSTNSIPRLFSYSALVAGMSLTMSPMVAMVNEPLHIDDTHQPPLLSKSQQFKH